MLGVDVSLSMWGSMATWFTPAVLFCVMNLMIGTIFIASNNNKRHDHGDSSTLIPRVSSLFEGLKSVNLSSNTTPTAVTAGDSKHRHPSTLKSADYGSLSRLAQSIYSSSPLKTSPDLPSRYGLYQSESEPRSLSQSAPATESEDRVKSLKSGAVSGRSENDDSEHQVMRSKSDRSGVSPAKMKKSSAEMKKSRSEMRIPSEEEDVHGRRAATARERRNAAFEGVDAQADDFISRFKQQLKLQRIDSLVRFKEMLNRGT